MTILAQDTFIRANQSTFGTASDGKTWSYAGNTGTESIVSNEGVFSTVGGDTHALIGAGTAATVNILVRVQLDNQNDFGGAFARYSGTGGVNGYRCGLFNNTIQLDKYVTGTRSSVGSAAFTFTADATHFYWVRFVLSGTTLTGTAWADGGSEPGSPQLSLTDSSITAAGQYGVSANLFSGNVQVDHLTVTDNQSSGTQSIRDIATRFRLKSADQLKDIKTRFRLKSADQLKDVVTRFRLKSADQLKDITTRFRLMSATQFKDISSRFRLMSATQLKDISTRFRFMSANQLKDIKTRFRLMSANIPKDISTRFILALASQRLKDISTRFRLISANQLKDIASRFILAAANTRTKDIICRFILAGGNITTTTAYGRDGKVVASGRNSTVIASSRDGLVTARGR